jgi:hypothetical protein
MFIASSGCQAKKREEILNTQLTTIRKTEAEVNNLQRMLYKGMIEESFYTAEKQELEDRLIVLRGQFEDQQTGNKRNRELMDKYFNFARYTKEDFESNDDAKKKEVMSIIGQNLLFKDNRLLFEPIKYLIPLVEKQDLLKSVYDKVQTFPQQMKKDAEASMISVWCTRQDSNLRPLAPQANALSS